MDADEKVKEVLIEAGREGITAINLAKELGLKEDRKSAYNLVYRAKQKHPSWENKIAKKSRDGDQVYVWTDLDKGKLFDAVTNLSNEVKKTAPNRCGVDIALETERDTLLLVVGADWHLGDMYVDYDGVRTVMEDIGDHSGVYFLGLGDLIDNSINTHSPQGTQNIVDKNRQIEMVEYLFDLAGQDSILRLYEGNHELRSYISDQFLPTKWMAIQSNSKYGHYMEPFIIKMPDRDWTFFCRHKPKYSSQYNPVHGCVRAPMYYMGKLARDSDIIITAHTHRHGMAVWEVAGKERYMLSTGCSVEFNHYAERIGYMSGKETIPAVILRKNYKPELVLDYKEALRKYGDELDG